MVGIMVEKKKKKKARYFEKWNNETPTFQQAFHSFEMPHEQQKE